MEGDSTPIRHSNKLSYENRNIRSIHGELQQDLSGVDIKIWWWNETEKTALLTDKTGTTSGTFSTLIELYKGKNTISINETISKIQGYNYTYVLREHKRRYYCQTTPLLIRVLGKLEDRGYKEEEQNY